MGLVGDDESEVRGRKQLLELVVEEQGLHGTDNNPGLPPIVAFLFVDDCPEVVAEQVIEYLMRPAPPVPGGLPGRARDGRFRNGERA